MEQLEKLINDLKEVRDDLQSYAVEVVEESEEEIITLNVEQLQAGITASGEEIHPEYAPRTIAIKRKKNQPFDRVTLRDTGAFQEGIYVKPFSDGFDISSSDSKTAGLVAKYGPEIFGLTEENKYDLARIVLQPRLESKIIQKLF